MLNLGYNSDWTDSSAKIAINNEDIAIANAAKKVFSRKIARRERAKKKWGHFSNSSL
mgnify:CR=1 FL=1